MLLEKTRMREIMLKARVMFNKMNTSSARRFSYGNPTGGNQN